MIYPCAVLAVIARALELEQGNMDEDSKSCHLTYGKSNSRNLLCLSTYFNK